MNRVLAHCGARVPILQAPMGWIARNALASAVSRAGGLGVIETSSSETANCQLPALTGQSAGLVHAVKQPVSRSPPQAASNERPLFHLVTTPRYHHRVCSLTHPGLRANH